MKKLLFISIIGLAFCAFTPNTSFAGNPLKDLAKIGKAPDKKPAKATKTAKINRRGSRGHDNKKILDRLEVLEAAFKKMEKENVHSGNINKHLLPFWVVLVLAILLGLMGIGLTIKSLLLENTVRENVKRLNALTDRVSRTAPPTDQSAGP